MLNQNREQQWRDEISCSLAQLLKNQGEIMALSDQVLAAVNGLGTAVSKEIADATAYIASVVATNTDPNEVANLNAALASLGNIQTAVTSFDGSIPAPQGTSTGTSTVSGTGTGS